MESIKLLTYYKRFEGNYPNGDNSDYVMNRCFSYELDGENTLVTTSHGGWVILNRSECDLLLEGKVKKDKNLYSVLERTGIILTPRNRTGFLRISCEQYAHLNRAPTRLIIWYNSKSSGLEEGERLKEVGSKAIDFFLSIPHLFDHVDIEFRGDVLSQYDLVRELVIYAMRVSCRKKKRAVFTIVSSPHFLTDEIVMDFIRLQIRYRAYFDGSASATNGLKKFKPHLQTYQRLPIQLIAFPVDHIGREALLVDTCIALDQYRLTLEYADASHPVKKYRTTDLSSEVYYNFWKNTLELILQHNRDGVFLAEGQTRELLKSIIVRSANSGATRRPCRAGISQFIVDLSGRILACYCAEWLEMGNVFTDTYDAVITSENEVTTRGIAGDLLPKCSTCAFNAYCGHCPIRSLRQHGSSLLEEPDDFECQSYIRMIPYLFKKLGDVEDAKILTKWV